MKQVVRNSRTEKQYRNRVTSNVVKNLKSNEMKTIKMNSVKMLASFSFLILLLISSCTQTGNGNNTKSANNSKAKSMVEKPKIDIQTAIISDNLELVKQHIDAGTDIDKKDELGGATPLMLAITFGKTAIAKALIDANADLTIKNNDGSTALHIAAFFGRIEIVQLLIDARADKTVKNNFGATPRETVIVPFADVKSIYEMIQLQLEPLNFHINLNEVEKNRPVIAMMLQ